MHRVLARLFDDRGVKIERTYQLNVGGNTDFMNMLERERLESKKISKTNAVTSQLDYDLGAGQRAHRPVRPRAVAPRPQVGVHPRRGPIVRRRAADRRAEARGLGLAELGGHRHRRRPADQAGARPRHLRRARLPVGVPDEVAADPASRRGRARRDRALHRRRTRAPRRPRPPRRRPTARPRRATPRWPRPPRRRARPPPSPDLLSRTGVAALPRPPFVVLAAQPGSVARGGRSAPARAVRACLPGLPVRAAPFPKAGKARSAATGCRSASGASRPEPGRGAAWRLLVGCDARRDAVDPGLDARGGRAHRRIVPRTTRSESGPLRTPSSTNRPCWSASISVTSSPLSTSIRAGPGGAS